MSSNNAIKPNNIESKNVVSLSIGNSVRDNMPIKSQFTLTSLEGLFTEPEINENKDGSYYVAALFSGRRSNDSVVEVTGLSLDLDVLPAGGMSEVVACFSGSAFVAYTTFSSSPENPRVRVFVPYSSPITANHHRKIALHYQNVLGADSCSSCLSQPMYLPRCSEKNSCNFEVVSTLTTSPFLDPNELPLEDFEGARYLVKDGGRVIPSNYDIGEPKLDGQRTEWLTKIIGRLIKVGYNDQQILETVKVANQKNDPPLPDEKLNVAIESIRKGDLLRHADCYDPDGIRKKDFTCSELEELLSVTSTDSLAEILLPKISQSGLAEFETEKLLKAIKMRTGLSLGALRNSLQNYSNQTEGFSSDIEVALKAIECFGEGDLFFSKGRYWFWGARGCWEVINDLEVKRVIHSLFKDSASKKKLTGSRVNSIIELLKTEIFRVEGLSATPETIINLENGELHFEHGGWVLRPANKNNMFVTQLPVVYDKAQKAPRFEQFLNEIFEGDSDREDKILVLLQMLGYSMLTTCKFESFILLIGSGSNGKSVFLDVVRAMLGQANVSGVQPSQFGQRFQRAHLLGKLANIITEVSEGYVLHDAELKAIVSGELMTAEFKGKDPFDFAPYATCWFGTNHLPATRDFSSALFRRAIVVSFNRSFTEVDRDPDLKGKLLQELPGILNLVLHATQELFTKGRFRAPASSNEIKKKWRFDADQVAQFINDCCRLEGDSSVISSVLYNEYRCWARDNGIKNALGHARFSARVANFDGCSLSRGTGGVRMIRGVFPKS